MNGKEIREYIIAKREPISHCIDLTKYFIGRHRTLPVYLTTAFEMEFNSTMRELEELREKVKKQKEVIDKAIEYINPLITNRDDEHYYAINWYNKDVLLDILKEVSEMQDKSTTAKEILHKMQELEKENKQLKEQFERCKNKYNIKLNNKLSENIEPDLEDFYLAEIESKSNDYDKCKTQQKEFIKYLEKRYEDVTSVIGSFGSNTDLLYGKKDMIEEILQKYREIIGDDKEW